jgi:hypothetical protein
LDDPAPTESPADIERRAIWLAVAAAVVLFLRSTGGFGFYTFGSPEHLDRQIWFFIVGTVLFGASVVLAALVALPEYVAYPARITVRWNPVRLYGWALLLFVLGVVITAISGIWSAADTLGTSPFNN